MGKIRVKVLGDEKKEKLDKKRAQQRAEAKKKGEETAAEAAAKKTAETKPVKTEKEAAIEPKAEVKEVTVEKEKIKKASKFKKTKKQQHSDSYIQAAKLVEVNKKYKLKEALEILPKLKRAKFDETVELHINTLEKGVSGVLSLPHGTGKKMRIEIANQTVDPKHVEEIVKQVEGGKIEFDVLIATPDAMPKLAKIARFLGPRGLMPNPKSGTVTPTPDKVAKKFESGQVNFKTEAKFPILHLTIGKVSFGDEKLSDNIRASITAVQAKNIKDVTLKSTMSPGIKLDTAELA